MLKFQKLQVVKALVFLLSIGCMVDKNPEPSSQRGGGPNGAKQIDITAEDDSADSLEWHLSPSQICEAIDTFERSGEENTKSIGGQPEIQVKTNIRDFRRSIDSIWGPVWLVWRADGGFYKIAEKPPLVVKVDYGKCWEHTGKTAQSRSVDSSDDTAEGTKKAALTWEEAVVRARAFVVNHWGEAAIRGLRLDSGTKELMVQGQDTTYYIGWNDECISDVVLGRRWAYTTVDVYTGRVVEAWFIDSDAPELVMVDQERFRQIIEESMGNVPGLEVRCISLQEGFENDGSRKATWTGYLKWSCEGYPDKWLASPCEGRAFLIVDALTGKVIDKGTD